MHGYGTQLCPVSNERRSKALKYILALIGTTILLTACTKQKVVEVPKVIPQLTITEGEYSYKIESNNLQGIRDYIVSTERKGLTPAQLTEDFQYIPSVPGNQVDIEKVLHDVNSGKLIINLQDYYITETDENDAIYKKLSDQILNFNIRYSNGETLSANDCCFTVSADNTLIPNEEAIKERVKDITFMYDTVEHEEYDYTTHDGKTIHVTGGTWGDLSDTLAEQDYVLQKVSTLQSEDNRVPIMKEESPDEIPEHRLEVNIAEQTLYEMNGNEIVSISPVVTGLVPKRSTPTGIFKILEKRKEKDLRGPGYVSHVHRWLRLTWTGVGLHDATWRSSFGGNIYTRDGSHGCINLPVNYAYDLYDSMNVGDCVIVYNEN